MKTRWSMAIAACGVFVVGGCAAAPPPPIKTPPVILYEGPDRPNAREIEGPAPPSDYKFGPTERVSDTNDDKRADRIEFVDDGDVTLTAEDTNFDGKIDVYKKISHGVVVEEVRDRNFDGILDQRSRDTDGDGTLDLLEPLNP